MRFGLIGERAPAAFDFVWAELPSGREVVHAGGEPEADETAVADGAVVIVGPDLFEGRPIWEVTGLVERYREVGAEEFVFDGLDDEQLALVASDLIPEMRAEEAAASREEEAEEPEPNAEESAVARPPSGLAQKGRTAFARRVEGMSDERLAKLAGSRAGMAVLFRSMARLYRPDKAGDFRGTIEFRIGTPRGEDIWTIACGEVRAAAHHEADDEADLRIDADVADFVRIGLGQMSGPAAMLKGKIRARGNMGAALRLEGMFGG
jgi:putative sterol carrier protein